MLRNLLLHLILSAVGVLVGISACIVFCIVYNNHDIGFWSSLSAILAAACFHLHWIKLKGTLERWHTRNTLRHINIMGFISAVAGITGLIWYLFSTFYYKIPILPIADSTAITAVWSMICGKWGIILMYHSHTYGLIIQEGSLPILSETSA